MRTILLTIFSLFLLVSCESESSKVSYAVDPENRGVTVTDVLQANAYTYLEVDENGDEFWIAVPTMEAKKGDKVYFSKSMEMVEFYSRDLDRTFDKVLFVDNISSSPIPASMPVMSPSTYQGGNPKTEPKEVHVKAQEGTISIAELFKDPSAYENKIIKVNGEVTKFNSGILGSNWAHIQDGTSFENHFDLTVTTQDVVPMGDNVVFEGKIVLNKDLGSGYFFDILMEDAKATRAVMY